MYSQYACGKLFAHWQTSTTANPKTFSTATASSSTTNPPAEAKPLSPFKITRAIACIIAKQQDKLYLGNLDSKRDWGYAKD
jgi:GDPmannose 4,6-dehydratase